MADDAPEATEPEPELTETEEEFRALHTDVAEAKSRMMKLAHAKATSPEISAIYRELGGTILELFQDFVAACGGAFVAVEEDVERLADGEQLAEGSILRTEDGQVFIACFEQNLRLLTELRSAASGDQGEVFDTLIRMNTEALDLARDITVEEEAEPEPEAEKANGAEA